MSNNEPIGAATPENPYIRHILPERLKAGAGAQRPRKTWRNRQTPLAQLFVLEEALPVSTANVSTGWQAAEFVIPRRVNVH